jgi:DNA-binding NtrC family response regulator
MAHILVIDDEPPLRAVLEKVLMLDGHRVDTAENGKQGLKLLELFSYDLVITDIVMPEKDGFEVIGELHRKFSHTKLIAITGGTARLGQDYLMSAAKTMRVNKVFAKPLNYEKLKSVVKELLETE